MLEATTVNGQRRTPLATRMIPEATPPEERAEVAAPPDPQPLRDGEFLSFIIPVKDEEATLGTLHEAIARECDGWAKFEVVFIDDGSRDDSWGVIQRLAQRHPEQVRGLRFRRNRGKAAAWMAGFRAARGTIVLTMDADLQDDPAEIRRLVAKLDEGYDLVTGYKKVRHDPWHKVLPSRVFNAMLSRVSGVSLHDHNCGFKCFRAEVARALSLHGELHRMVPALAAQKGYRTGEVVVQHHPRRHGNSKYGIERFLRGFMDMVVVGFLGRYRERPSHCFGAVAAFCGLAGLAAIGGGMAGALLASWRLGAAVAVTCGTMMIGFGLMATLLGILAELLIQGGLETTWVLPITEDTATQGQDVGRATPLCTTYHGRGS